MLLLNCPSFCGWHYTLILRLSDNAWEALGESKGHHAFTDMATLGNDLLMARLCCNTQGIMYGNRLTRPSER